jgi:1-acyl-sn-glycerol-3-phosphate acyltransferase
MTLRAVRRAVALAFALVTCILCYWLLRVRGRITLFERSQWLHQSSCRVLKSLGIRPTISGRPPAHGLVVANHLSYLDIAIISAVMPCFFVSKLEIAAWPYFGEAARVGGTIFIDRRSRASTGEVARQISDRLQLPVPVLLFPEGTSSDGSQVLRFHSSLFEPAVVAGAPVTAAAVRYVLGNGAQERDLCWFDDTLFLPHLWKALGTAAFSAEVAFGEPRVYSDRRIAADVSHDEVASMRGQEQLSPVSQQISAASAVAEN